METFEGGSPTEPNLGLQVFTLEGEPMDSNDCIRDLVGEKGLRALQDLSRKIAGLLQEHEITVLSPEELRKPVPWLRGGEEVFVGAGGEPVTLQDALFFESL